jgi:hypothetical protein
MTVDAVTDLSCMDGANMAAIALQMQLTALETEQRILDLERRQRAALNRPTKVQRSTATITGYIADVFPGDQSVGPFNSAGNWVVDFDNTGVNSNIDATAMNAALGAGVYEVGIACNVIASGAVTDNSYRIIRILLYRADPTAFDGFVLFEEASLTLYESNTGVGVDFSVVGEFRMETTDKLVFALQHANAGSTLNLTIGALVWMTKKSSNDAVVVT